MAARARMLYGAEHAGLQQRVHKPEDFVVNLVISTILVLDHYLSR